MIIVNTNLFKSIDYGFYDQFIILNKSDIAENNIVIVKIDNKSLLKLGKWPWKRDVYCKFLDILFKDKAKIAGFYIDFSLSADPVSDKYLINSLKKYSTTIISPFVYEKESSDNRLWKELSKSVTFGHDRFITSQDSVVRNNALVLNKIPSFAMAVLNIYDNSKFKYFKHSNSLKIRSKTIKQINNRKLLINFKHSWNQFVSYSFIDVINKKITPDAFKNKIVLIGVTKDQLTEFYTTPLSKKFSYSGNVAPVYIQAQIIDSLLNFDIINNFEMQYSLLILFILIPCIVCLIKTTDIIKQLIILSVIFPIIWVLISFASLKYFNLWVSPTAYIISSILIFILLATGQIFKISALLDKYIFELSKKSDSNEVLKMHPDIDNKFERLKEITDIINKDRTIFDTVLSSANNIIILFNQNGKIIYSNCENKDFNINDYSGLLSFEEIIKEITNNSFYRKDIRFKNKHFEFKANKAGEEYFTGVFNDITEIVKSNELKATILRMLSHEIKAPISTILLSSDYLLNHIQNTKYEKHIDKILNQAELIKELIDRFLELNKLEVVDLNLIKESSDIEKVLKTAIEDFSIIAANKNINIIYKGPSEPLIISCDKNYLDIAFKNILDNAIKYSPEKTTVTISLESINSTCKIKFKDEGYGISKEDKDKLFDKFYRIKNIHTKGISGTGLGLSFVKRIIEMHNGFISIESTIDKGSTVIIALPYEQ
ncbi:MAG: CHASE2 domain-containing protein [Cyanobacteriota bacterium]